MKVRQKLTFTILTILRDKLDQGDIEVARFLIDERLEKHPTLEAIQDKFASGDIDSAKAIINQQMKEIGLQICEAKLLNKTLA